VRADCRRITRRAIAVRRVPNGRKHPDLREHVSLRGGARKQGSWLAHAGSEGSLQPFASTEPATMGCSSTFGGGAPLATSFMRRRMRGEGGSFAPGCSAHAAHSYRFNSSPAQPVARSERRPQAALRRAVAFHLQTSRRACMRRETRVDGVDVARCPLTSKEVG